ncbi:PREDICTED: interleukin-12 receptor subunit beta-2-like [Cyprinodon variegatus]|uniref:interleukin-12 receptor subunit beta-2-like n=1 Tax=Cyprinodon variegatus TaxID=28743 RepID=UPI000742C521|nr:PREDICTED: interleukin-12 receptor subunit beta-2-like [Cyprinodon variegatus]
MATSTPWWLLVFALQHCCFSNPGPPPPPSNLQCHRPCSGSHCLDIKCIWNPKPHLDTSTTYSLHWKKNAEDEKVNRSSSDGLIRRAQFESHAELLVWVQAKNQFGSVESEPVVIHTQNIIKPSPPQFQFGSRDPLEIFWNNSCENLQQSVEDCEVAYNTEEDRNQIQYEEELTSSFAHLDPQPNTVYEFQVRCKCDSSLFSDWSETFSIKSAESAPVGEVDAWWDCGPSSCFLNWKNLSNSQARGYILSYEVTVLYNNGTIQLMNVSTDDPSSLYIFDGMNWRLTSPLKDVSSVNISAYNALGATKASPLPMLTPDKQADFPNIDLEMNSENLTVSWNPPPNFSDQVKQYVVQYKDCGLGEFDWIKVNNHQTTGFFKGAFKNYTPYQVSLFVVSNLNEVRHLATARGYSSQRVPSVAPVFDRSEITGTEMTLFWKPVPSCNQSAMILYYQIGVSTQRVYNVSVTPDHEGMTYKLSDLSPGEEYQVWIRAVSKAGPSPKVTRTFRINPHEGYRMMSVYLVTILVVLLAVIICLCGCLLSFFRGVNKMWPLLPQCLNEKVPDPSNSKIFRQMRLKVNEPLTWICVPLHEPSPKISVLEVVAIKSKVFEPDGIRKENGFSQMDCQDDQKQDLGTENTDSTDSGFERKEYSKMVDSDEEKNDGWSSSEEEQSTSGYEKHFMPSALEIMVE